MIYAGKFGIIFFILMLIFTFFYCLTLTWVMKCVPRDKQKFPAWFIWFFLIPVVGLLFQWLMQPFGIPGALKRNFSENKEALHDADLLFKIGLAQVIFTTGSILLPLPPINDVLAALDLIMLVLYWVKIVKFKHAYLQNAIK